MPRHLMMGPPVQQLPSSSSNYLAWWLLSEKAQLTLDPGLCWDCCKRKKGTSKLLGNQALLSWQRERQKRRSEPKEHHWPLTMRVCAVSQPGRKWLAEMWPKVQTLVPGSPEQALGGPGPLRQSKEEMGEVQSGPAAGLASMGGPSHKPKGLRVMRCFALSAEDPLLQGAVGWQLEGFGAGGT